MSFNNPPGYVRWQRFGCVLLGLFLVVANVLLLIGWYFSFYDLSTDTYRSFVVFDLIIPFILLASVASLRLYVRLVMRDKE